MSGGSSMLARLAKDISMKKKDEQAGEKRKNIIRSENTLLANLDTTPIKEVHSYEGAGLVHEAQETTQPKLNKRKLDVQAEGRFEGALGLTERGSPL